MLVEFRESVAQAWPTSENIWPASAQIGQIGLNLGPSSSFRKMVGQLRGKLWRRLDNFGARQTCRGSFQGACRAFVRQLVGYSIVVAIVGLCRAPAIAKSEMGGVLEMPVRREGSARGQPP